MKNVILILALLLGVTIYAQDSKPNKNAKYEITVNGNCDMCKKRIEKAAYSVKGVKLAQWYQDHQDVHLIIDERKTNIDMVCKAIAEAGHDTDRVKADDEVYERLHHCCLYERLN
ncbi:MAG: metal transporter [Bacteroidota bacterium]|nr:metal transporter [Bacteroidota bacterium]